jgi:hypothetical protein
MGNLLNHPSTQRGQGARGQRDERVKTTLLGFVQPLPLGPFVLKLSPLD